MSKVLMMKTICETGNGFLFCAKEMRAKAKSRRYVGNIPKLPNGSVLDIETDGERVTEYHYELTDRNRKLLESKKIDAAEFMKKIEVHKETGLLWTELKDIKNPYRFYPFPRADKIFQAMGKKENDTTRISAITEEVVKGFRNKRKDTYEVTEYIDMFRDIEETGAYRQLPVPDVINTVANGKFLFNGQIKDRELYDAQNFILQNIKTRERNTSDVISPGKIEKFLEKDTKASDEQKSAVKDCRKSNVTVVTGGAGNGKTSTIQLIIGCYEEVYGKEDICLLAPTGRASRRMTETTGFEASTIHSKIRKMPGSDFVYYNRSNPLPYKLFIIDESSMIDTLLMRDLLSAIPDKAKIYFIGDFNQLYPVGCGEPFFDFIDKNLCNVIWLTKNFRQGEGEILENGKRILRKEPVVAADDFEIRHIHRYEILDYVREDIQNISPYNELNTYINKHILKKYLTEKEAEQGVFFKGEKIITNENTDEYSNGDIGTVLSITNEGILIDINEGTVMVPMKDLKKNVSPAYALTVHKTQGSEYPEINIFVPEGHRKFVTARMMYTAVTRARKKVNLYFYDEIDTKSTVSESA